MYYLFLDGKCKKLIPIDTSSEEVAITLAAEQVVHNIDQCDSALLIKSESHLDIDVAQIKREHRELERTATEDAHWEEYERIQRGLD